MADIKIFNPDGLAKPAGTYQHVAQAKTQNVVFIAGQVPMNAAGATIATTPLVFPAPVRPRAKSATTSASGSGGSER